jgi:alpha-ribazole phosphatase
MRLHLVRHLRPDIADGLCYGSSDVAAASDDQAYARLLTTLPRQAPLYSSPLRRCAGLANTLASSLGCGEPVYDARLAEMHFGAWEMRAWSDIPREEVDAWTADLIHYRPGGGESVLQVAQRAQAFLDDVSKRDAEDVIVICHAGTIRLLSAAARGSSVEQIALAAAQQAHAIPYASVTVLECGA